MDIKSPKNQTGPARRSLPSLFLVGNVVRNNIASLECIPSQFRPNNTTFFLRTQTHNNTIGAANKQKIDEQERMRESARQLREESERNSVVETNTDEGESLDSHAPGILEQPRGFGCEEERKQDSEREYDAYSDGYRESDYSLNGIPPGITKNEACGRTQEFPINGIIREASNTDKNPRRIQQHVEDTSRVHEEKHPVEDGAEGPKTRKLNSSRTPAENRNKSRGRQQRRYKSRRSNSRMRRATSRGDTSDSDEVGVWEMCRSESTHNIRRCHRVDSFVVERRSRNALNVIMRHIPRTFLK